MAAATSTKVVFTNTGNNPYLARAYAVKDSRETRSVYDDWATTYDSDMRGEAQNYVGPALAAQALVKAVGKDRIGSVKTLDAGCGTGLAGVRLAELGGKNIDGVDLSEGMLKVASLSGAYQLLETADLSVRTKYEDNSYDALICVGTLTHAHVGPEAIEEFLRIVKPNGFIVATVLGDIWEGNGYKTEVERLVSAGKAELVSADLEDYRRGAGVRAIMLVLRVR